MKLSLKTSNSLCVATTKFEIFLRWFGTFFTLIEFSREFTINYTLNWVHPLNDPEWCQTLPNGLLCPRRQIFVEVDAKLYCFEYVIRRISSHAAQKNVIIKIIIRKT